MGHVLKVLKHLKQLLEGLKQSLRFACSVVGEHKKYPPNGGEKWWFTMERKNDLKQTQILWQKDQKLILQAKRVLLFREIVYWTRLFFARCCCSSFPQFLCGKCGKNHPRKQKNKNWCRYLTNPNRYTPWHHLGEIHQNYHIYLSPCLIPPTKNNYFHDPPAFQKRQGSSQHFSLQRFCQLPQFCHTASTWRGSPSWR